MSLPVAGRGGGLETFRCPFHPKPFCDPMPAGRKRKDVKRCFNNRKAPAQAARVDAASLSVPPQQEFYLIPGMAPGALQLEQEAFPSLWCCVQDLPPGPRSWRAALPHRPVSEAPRADKLRSLISSELCGPRSLCCAAPSARSRGRVLQCKQEKGSSPRSLASFQDHF